MQPPRLQVCWNDSEDEFPLPAVARAIYGPFGFPPPPPERPYVAANFAQSLDGRVAFADLPGQAGGDRIAQSEADQWLAAMFRAHQDALLLGAATLRAEPGPDGRGYDYGQLPEPWRSYRREVLKLAPLRVIIATRTGFIPSDHRLFTSSETKVWIATTASGARRLRSGPHPEAEVFVPNSGDAVEPRALAAWARQLGVRRLLCEAGPELYSQLLSAGLVDEEFRTIAMQVVGQAPAGAPARPTAYGALSFRPETAPWHRIISLHAARPYHLFLRLRRSERPRAG